MSLEITSEKVKKAVKFQIDLKVKDKISYKTKIFLRIMKIFSSKINLT